MVTQPLFELIIGTGFYKTVSKVWNLGELFVASSISYVVSLNSKFFIIDFVRHFIAWLVFKIKICLFWIVSTTVPNLLFPSLGLVHNFCVKSFSDWNLSLISKYSDIQMSPIPGSGTVFLCFSSATFHFPFTQLKLIYFCIQEVRLGPIEAAASGMTTSSTAPSGEIFYIISHIILLTEFHIYDIFIPK